MRSNNRVNHVDLVTSVTPISQNWLINRDFMLVRVTVRRHTHYSKQTQSQKGKSKLCLRKINWRRAKVRSIIAA